MLKILLITMISLSTIGFADEASEQWNDALREIIQANENEVVDHYNEDKIYVKPEKIYPTSRGIYLNLTEQEFIFIPNLSSDDKGCYVECGLRAKTTRTCPGCEREYFYGGCKNAECLEFQRQKNYAENLEKEKQRGRDEYKKKQEAKKH